MATLEWKFKRDGDQDVLVLTGDYSRDWQPWKNGNGYFGRVFVPFKNGVTLCVDAHIFGKPAGKSRKLGHVPPPSGNWTLKFLFGKAVFLDGLIALQMPLQRCIELAVVKPKRYLQENLPGMFTEVGSTYRVMIAIQVKGEYTKRPGVSWEAGQPMTYGGGLFESNRRRH